MPSIGPVTMVLRLAWYWASNDGCVLYWASNDGAEAVPSIGPVMMVLRLCLVLGQ